MLDLKTPKDITSLEFFRSNWISWKIAGVALPSYIETSHNSKRSLYILWCLIVHIVSTLSFPFHLGLAIFESTNKSIFFDAVSITVTSIGAAIKTIMFIIKMRKVKEMEAILMRLDARIVKQDEKQYFHKEFRRNVGQVQNTFVYMYLAIILLAALLFVTSGERRLFYPGWFPLDWRHSVLDYAIVISYQLLGIFLQLMQNFTNDSFPPKALCVLSGHIKLLYIRISKIGNENEHERTTLKEQESELVDCILDQKNLYELFDVIQNIISWPMFMQIFVSVVNNCVAMVALLFFVTDPLGRFYYSIYIAGVSMELFPTCYYGSDFVLLFEELHYAVFSTNWIGQSKSYKRNMLILTERTLRKTVAMAGNLFPIHLTTFFAACKTAYSLFAVIMTMK